MQVRGRALYNLLRLTKADAQSWQVEDYRALSDDELFSRLHKLKILLDLEGLRPFIQNVDSPEALLEYLVSTESDRNKAEQIYLLLFEIWRRHFVDHHCLSIFCDQLDYLIQRYDENDEEVLEDLYNQLDALVDLMDESVDETQSESEVMEYIASYLSHDVERLLYDFINLLIENENEIAATELIEGYEPYVKKKLAWELLKLKLYAVTDTFDTENMVTRYGETLVDEKDSRLGVDYLSFLYHQGEMHTFSHFFPKIIDAVTSKSDFEKLETVTSEYLDSLDQNHTHYKLLSQLLATKQKGLKV